MPLPQYLPIELAIQNYSRKLWQWKHLYALHEQYKNEGSKKDLDEAKRQLDDETGNLRRALARPLE